MERAPQEIRTYFVTAITAARRRLFQVERHADLFLEVVTVQRAKGRLALHAFVLMPDHVHLLLTPAPEVSLEKAVQYIKGNFSFQLKSRMDVWQPGYDSRRVSNPADYRQHVTYIERNPLRAGLIRDGEMYAYGSTNHSGMTDAAPTWFR